MTHPDSVDFEKSLSKFGLDSFRTGQKEVISSLFAGKDCLCVMPTGGGKSLCYQLPSVARDGVTIVISPLIALMKDQVDSLTSRDISATCINSSLSGSEQRNRLDQIARNEFDLVYIAPERLRSMAFRDAIRKTNVQLLAVDEAHCISEWGHDFRPDYSRIGRFRQRLGNPQTIALTATATKNVRDDICQILELEQPSVFVTGFTRENLSFEVQVLENDRAKEESLVNFLNEVEGAGIIYCATRKKCEELVEFLRGKIRRRVDLYHGGLEPDQRRSVQDRFMSSEIPIIIATNAFGMGIDKSDLRFVAHFNMPGTLEAYYQEAGRAGRDGLPSRCLMLFNYRDRFIQEFFIENKYPSRETVEAVYNFLCQQKQDPIEITQQQLKELITLPVGAEGVGACEQVLDKCGAIERLDSTQNLASVRIDSDLSTIVDMLPREATTRRAVLREIERIIGENKNERVFFQPQTILNRLDLKIDGLNRAIRELNKLEVFNYVPPFRGRAIHVINSSTPFRELKIDFEELHKRKHMEFEKLDAVIRYAYSKRCRQLEIIEYFGDPDRKRCGQCDLCTNRASATGKNPAKDRILTTNKHRANPICHYAARIALSGAARMNNRFGKSLLVLMLCGSESDKIRKTGLKKIKTFGKMKRLRQTEVSELVDALIDCGHLEQVEKQKFRPIINLSKSGRAVMLDKSELSEDFRISDSLFARLNSIFGHEVKKLEAARPKAAVGESAPIENSPTENSPVKTSTSTNPAEGNSADANSTQLKNGLRIEVFDSSNFASDEMNVEEVEYESFPDMLDENFSIEDENDSDEDESDEHESGERESSETNGDQEDDYLDESEEQYGVENQIEREVQDLFNNLDDDHDAPDVPASHLVKPSSTHQAHDGRDHSQREYYWTMRLLKDGYSVEEVAEIRRLSKAKIQSHIELAKELGQNVAPDLETLF